MYRNMEQWSEIRRRVLVDGVSRRQILRETGMHWLTLKKILEHSQPPGYRQLQRRRKTKLGDYLKRIEEILKADQAMPRKQQYTAKRIWERLREEGFTGGYTVVKDVVRDLTKQNQEVFVPLVQPARGGAGGFRPRAGEGERAVAQGGVLRDGAALQRRVLRDGVRARMHGDVLGGACAGVRVFRRRAPAHHLRQHEGGGEPDSGQGAAVDAGLSPAQESPPF
jgi:hypothetical protein